MAGEKNYLRYREEMKLKELFFLDTGEWKSEQHAKSNLYRHAFFKSSNSEAMHCLEIFIWFHSFNNLMLCVCVRVYVDMRDCATCAHRRRVPISQP